MTILKTQLRPTSPGTNLWADTAFANAARIIINYAGAGNFYVEDFTDANPSNDHFQIQGDVIYFTDPAKISNGDSYDTVTHIYTFGDGKPNRFQSDTILPDHKEITQPTIAGLASTSVVLDADGNPEVLSKLTSVISSDETVNITITDGQVDLSANTTIPSDLSVSTVTTTGNVTVGGNNVVTGDITAGGNAQITGSVNATEAAFTGSITAGSADFTGGSVKADYVQVKFYPSNQIPTNLPAGAFFGISAAV